jgi:hypothetical protein
MTALRQASPAVRELRICGSRTCKPNSVCLPRPITGPRTTGRSFLWATHYCEALATYPEVVAHRASTRPAGSVSLRLNNHRDLPNRRDPSLFGLAPCGVCHARVITAAAVRSYRTFSPLPRRFDQASVSTEFGGLEETAGRYIFCGTFRPPGLNPVSRTLSGTLLCGVRTFLPAHSDRS